MQIYQDKPTSSLQELIGNVTDGKELSPWVIRCIPMGQVMPIIPATTVVRDVSERKQHTRHFREESANKNTCAHSYFNGNHRFHRSFR